MYLFSVCIRLYGGTSFHGGHVEVRGRTKHRSQLSPFITSLRGHRPSDLAESASLGRAICCPIFMLKHPFSMVPIEPKCFWSTVSLSSILNWDSTDVKCPQSKEVVNEGVRLNSRARALNLLIT